MCVLPEKAPVGRSVVAGILQFCVFSDSILRDLRDKENERVSGGVLQLINNAVQTRAGLLFLIYEPLSHCTGPARHTPPRITRL